MAGMAAAAAAAAMAAGPNVGFNSLIHHQMFQKPNSIASPFFLPAGQCFMASALLSVSYRQCLAVSTLKSVVVYFDSIR